MRVGACLVVGVRRARVHDWLHACIRCGSRVRVRVHVCMRRGCRHAACEYATSCSYTRRSAQACASAPTGDGWPPLRRTRPCVAADDPIPSHLVADLLRPKDFYALAEGMRTLRRKGFHACGLNLRRSACTAARVRGVCARSPHRTSRRTCMPSRSATPTCLRSHRPTARSATRCGAGRGGAG